MNLDALNDLRQYWETLRDGRVAPYRAELDPRQFEDVLENMFILEQLNPSQIRVRLAGMALCEMMGMEVRGMPPEAFMDAANRTGFLAHLETVLSGPSVVELDLVADGRDGRPVDARMLLLPLRSDFGEVSRILGCLVADMRRLPAPVNYAITAFRATPIEVRTGLAPDPELHPGFAEQAPAYDPGAQAPRLRSVGGNPDATSTPRRGHLRIVD